MSDGRTITFDEADVHPHALSAGRAAMVASITRQGVNDLNTITRDQFDRALASFLLAYNGYVAREQFGISVQVKAVLNGDPIPF